MKNTENTETTDEILQQETAETENTAEKPEKSTEDKPEISAGPDAEKSPDSENGPSGEEIAARLTSEAIKRQLGEWEKQENELRDIYPGFSLGEEIRKNPSLGRLLRSGLSVKEAYEAANFDSILASAVRYAARYGEKRAADSVRAGMERETETALGSNATELRHTDVGALTEKDILRILEDVKNGAKVRF